MSTQRIDSIRLKRPHNGRNKYPITPRTIDGDVLEFVMAVDAYKRANKLSFLRTSEIYNLTLFLGYRKVAPQMSHIGDVPRLVPTAERAVPA